MNKSNIFGYLVVILMIILIAKMYFESDSYNLKCVIASADGNKYCIRDRKNINQAADLLAETSQKLQTFVNHLKQKFPDRDEVKRIVEGFDPKKIKETLPTSEHTAYSENKGEKIALCLNKNKKEQTQTQLIDSNTLMFVALHEVSHVGNEGIGHEKDFWDTFKFILNEAVDFGIYLPVDYKKKPVDYCGDKITDSPYYDM